MCCMVQMKALHTPFFSHTAILHQSTFIAVFLQCNLA